MSLPGHHFSYKPGHGSQNSFAISNISLWPPLLIWVWSQVTYFLCYIRRISPTNAPHMSLVTSHGHPTNLSTTDRFTILPTSISGSQSHIGNKFSGIHKEPWYSPHIHKFSFPLNLSFLIHTNLKLRLRIRISQH